MTQSGLMSPVEAVTNTAIGYGIAIATQLAVFPLFGLQVTLAENLAIGVIFTAASVLRGYVLRRLFEGIRGWGIGLEET